MFTNVFENGVGVKLLLISGKNTTNKKALVRIHRAVHADRGGPRQQQEIFLVTFYALQRAPENLLMVSQLL